MAKPYSFSRKEAALRLQPGLTCKSVWQDSAWSFAKVRRFAVFLGDQQYTPVCGNAADAWQAAYNKAAAQ